MIVSPEIRRGAGTRETSEVFSEFGFWMGVDGFEGSRASVLMYVGYWGKFIFIYEFYWNLHRVTGI